MKLRFIPATLLLSLCLLACSEKPPSVEDDATNFTVKVEGVVKDKRTGLEWMRCTLGQNWDGKTCVGEAKKYSREEAQAAASAGWRNPTVRELLSLRYCSTGENDKDEAVNIDDGGNSVPLDCGDKSIEPTINQVIFPNTPKAHFLTSTFYVSNRSLAWYVLFADGFFSTGPSDNRLYVRLVRSNN